MTLDKEPGAISLCCGDWTATVFPSVGMNLASLRCRGERILREPDSLEMLRGNSVVYGNPIQLPNNRTHEGRFFFEGKEYTLPITEPAHNNNLHGDLHHSAFKVTGQGGDFVCGFYENKGEIYPFPFIAEVEIRLYEDRCEETIRISNTGNGNMPFTFGLHTLFDEREVFSVPVSEHLELTEDFCPTGKRLPLNEMEQAFVAGTASRGKVISGFYTLAGYEVTVGDTVFSVSDNFNCWVLWNQQGGMGFIAIEPQAGMANALNNGNGLVILAPGAEKAFRMTFSKKEVQV